MLAKLGKVLARIALGAASGAVAMVVIGQVVGFFAANCTVVCKPDVAATLGALSGAFAAFMVKGYEPG